MLILTFQVNCAAWHIPGIKEAIAMLLERWGDVRLIDVREAQRTAPEQMRIGSTQSEAGGCRRRLEPAGLEPGAGGRRPGMREGACKSCGAAIVWIRTQSGKSMPCNATPVYYIAKPRSGAKRIVTPNGEVIACAYTDDPSKATGTGFVPHWSTCPEAARFKKGG